MTQLATIPPLALLEPADDDALVELFIQLHAMRSKQTAANYRNDLNDFRRAMAWVQLKDVGFGHLQAFHAHLEQRGFSPASVRRKLMAVSSFMRFAKDTGYITLNPFAAYRKFIPPSENRIAERLIPEAKVWEIINAEPRRDRKLFLKFLYLSGARVSEALSFRLHDMQESEKPRGYYWTVRRKGNKKGECGITRELGDELIAYGKVKPFPWGRSWATEIVKRAGKRRGEPGFSPHWLRHCCGTYILVNGGSKDDAQWQLGHSSSKTTELYLHIRPGKLPSDLLKRRT